VSYRKASGIGGEGKRRGIMAHRGGG